MVQKFTKMKEEYVIINKSVLEELDSMDKDNQHLHSEIMQVVMWLYEKHGVWITVCVIVTRFTIKEDTVITH